MFQIEVIEKIKTHILCSVTFFLKIVPFMRYVEKYGRAWQVTDDNTTRRMRFACRITKATDTHSEYVILIAFPRQQWLRERVSMSCYTYIACLVSPVAFVFSWSFIMYYSNHITSVHKYVLLICTVFDTAMSVCPSLCLQTSSAKL
jgi:hypothetical protein